MRLRGVQGRDVFSKRFSDHLLAQAVNLCRLDPRSQMQVLALPRRALAKVHPLPVISRSIRVGDVVGRRLQSNLARTQGGKTEEETLHCRYS
jgi:hypothetical protein